MTFSITTDEQYKQVKDLKNSYLAVIRRSRAKNLDVSEMLERVSQFTKYMKAYKA